MQTTPSISIVIPNFNGGKIIAETIDCALIALETSQIYDYEIIVSDDASIDDSIAVIEANFKDIIIIKAEENTGFAGNVNRGVFASKKELILLLNSDVHLTEGYFTSLIPIFSNEKTFGVMGLIKDFKTFENQDGAKSPKLFLYNIESNKNIISENKVLPTFFLSGANALIRASYLKKIGGLCELFNPYYSEDVELGIRAWRLGWELYFQPNAICYHETSSTISKINSQKVHRIAKRNKYVLHMLHLPRILRIFYLVNITVNACFKLFVGNKIHFLALISFFKMYSAIRIELKIRSKSKINKYSFSLLQIVKKIKLITKNRTVQYQ
jgi:GT2 family glycosyltransferase